MQGRPFCLYAAVLVVANTQTNPHYWIERVIHTGPPRDAMGSSFAVTSAG